MVQANIDNTPVSIVLAGSESTTVPSGETWKVTIKLHGGATTAEINGKDVINADSNNDADPVETVLVGGDSVLCSGQSYQGLHIGGFVVN